MTEFSPPILFEKLEQRILLSSDSPLISADPFAENLESVPAVTSEISLDITPADALTQWQAAFPNDYYVVWKKDSPWDHLDQVTGPPAGVTQLQSISLDIGRNEYESTSFVITNTLGSTFSFTIISDASVISTTLRKGVWITAYDGSKVNDALSLIDANTVSINSGESMEIWVTLNGNNAAAGQYNSIITIEHQFLGAKTVDLAVTVHDVSLPDVLPVSTSYWDYVTPDDPQISIDAKLADLKSHYVNTAVVHPFYVPRFAVDAGGQLITDYTDFDDTIDMYEAGLEPETYVFEMLSSIYFQPTEYGRPDFMTPQWKSLFQDWLTGWVAHMQSRGIGYDKYYLSPYDERLDSDVYEVAKLIKETDPNVRVHTNALGTVQEITDIAPYVDVWTPYLYHWLEVGGVTGAMSQSISLSPNTSYDFSFYGKNGTSMVYWDLNFNGSTTRVANTLPATNWLQETHNFTTASDTTQVTINFYPTVGNGTILIDDVVLVGSGPNLVVNGDMELSTTSPPYGWSTNSATAITNITDPNSGSRAAEITSIPQGSNPSKDALITLLSQNPSYELWTYANPIGVLPSQADPYRSYRMPVWNAWDEGMTGYGTWIYNYQSLWNYEGSGDKGWSMTYDYIEWHDRPPEVSAQEMIITGKRWEATREGVEDYAYLHMLRSLIDNSTLPPDSSIILDAENALAYWTTTVLDDPSTDFASQAKVDIIAKILAFTPNQIPGDANGDGVVSAGDYASVQANFGNTGSAYIPGDANGDGVVSAGDYASVQANFGNTAAAAQPGAPINIIPSESAHVTESTTISINEAEVLTTEIMLSTMPSTIQTIEGKPVVGFRSNAKYRSLRSRSSNPSFVKSKIYSSTSIELAADLSHLLLGQKLENLKLRTFFSHLEISLVIDTTPELLSNKADQWKRWNL